MSQSAFPSLNRRTLLQLLAATGASSSAFGLRNAALAAEADTLVWARPTETTLYDPHASALSSAWNVQQLVYESLVTLDDNLEVVPSLATAWEWQGNKLVFTLRDGVKFANGRAMTQDDVVGSITRALGSAGNPWGLILRNLKATTKVGNNQVAMEFDGPNRAALAAMTASLVCIVPMVEAADKTWDATNDKFMGTGPYLVESHVANDHWVLVKNPNYWNAGLPKIGKLVVKTIASTQGIVAALTDGTADVASFEGNPDASALLAGIANVTVAPQRQTAYSFLALNAVTEGSIFKDLKVRQAVALALDRKQIVDFAFAGQSVASYGYTQFKLGDDSKLPLYARDVEKAKALIAEAKPAKTKVNLIYAGGDLDANVSQVIKQQLAEIGLDVQLEGLEEGVWLSRTWTGKPSEFDLNVTYFSGFSHPLITAHWWAPELAGFDAGHVAVDPAYTELLNKALFAASDADYDATMLALYARINEQANLIPLCSRTETVAWRSDRVNMTPSTMQAQEDVLAGVENFTLKG